VKWWTPIVTVAACTGLAHLIGHDYGPALRVLAAAGWAAIAFVAGVKVGKIDARDEIETRGDDEGAGA